MNQHKGFICETDTFTSHGYVYITIYRATTQHLHHSQTIQNDDGTLKFTMSLTTPSIDEIIPL
ncbi:type IV toxin-antitoxin system YeeU family antitoxin [Aeromonas hydrophila]|uniref:type IV toxin-antitoxin system YeeU family antitoxin n=1 Tax=Aeromonas hydrophila TaxID=644 RepID=UPI002441E0E3|nr:type IV toxin-antitoxin system YeeU family antitoxin [Aeromonas hydrophila]